LSPVVLDANSLPCTVKGRELNWHCVTTDAAIVAVDAAVRINDGDFATVAVLCVAITAVDGVAIEAVDIAAIDTRGDLAINAVGAGPGCHVCCLCLCLFG
jgi:hypothetical protein